jgi:hypothetical protein
MTGMQIIRMVIKRPFHYILNTDLLAKGFQVTLQGEELGDGEDEENDNNLFCSSSVCKTNKKQKEDEDETLCFILTFSVILNIRSNSYIANTPGRTTLAGTIYTSNMANGSAGIATG